MPPTGRLTAGGRRQQHADPAAHEALLEIARAFARRQALRDYLAETGDETNEQTSRDLRPIFVRPAE